MNNGYLKGTGLIRIGSCERGAKTAFALQNTEYGSVEHGVFTHDNYIIKHINTNENSKKWHKGEV